MSKPAPPADDAPLHRKAWAKVAVRVRSVVDSLRQSLFFIPALFVVGAVILATLLLIVDQQTDRGAVPAFLTTTVDSSRAILGAVASGTITAASIVFSLTLVAVQLSSGQHSPRVLRSFLGDRFQQMVIGLVVGTFTYSLIVLRAVRAPVEEGGEPIIPNLSVGVAVVLAIASLLAVLGSIDHTARSLKVESIANRLTNETLSVIRRVHRRRDEPKQEASAQAGRPAAGAALGPPVPVTAPISGWVQQLDRSVLAGAVASGSVIELLASVGSYVIEDAPVVTVTQPLDSPDDESALAALVTGVRAAYEFGTERTMQEDIPFGILRLVDVGLRALSPGINDPNTAIDIIRRLQTVLSALLDRNLAHDTTEGANVEIREIEAWTVARYLTEAYDAIRSAGQDNFGVQATLVEALASLHRRAVAIGHPSAPEIGEYLNETVALGAKASFLPRQISRIEQLAQRR